jgi:CheY-like chemotaxis protein
MDASGHILVAEDSAVDAFFLQRAFNRAGMAVALHVVRDGQDVVDYLQGVGHFGDRTENPLPRLLLLDLDMPRLNGFEVLRWLRQQPAFKALGVVIFSNSGEPRDVNRAYGLGANSYVVKPDSIEELNALIGRFKKSWLESTQGAQKKAA